MTPQLAFVLRVHGTDSVHCTEEYQHTMYDFHNSTDTLVKLFCFSSDFSSKSYEKLKSFINSPFFCSQFQSVNIEL